MEGCFVHALRNDFGGISFWLTCDEAYAVVAASVPTTYRFVNWQSVYRLAFSSSDVDLGQVVGGRGVACGGFDGIKYCQLARAGERLAFCAHMESNLIYVLTRSATPPTYSLEEI